jgi:polar amino acid transport system substrate-binding protein
MPRHLPSPAICLVLALASGGLAAQSKLVMGNEAWPPFRIDDPKASGGFAGIDIEVLRAIEKDLGLSVEIQHHPWARDLEMLKEGQADIITGIARTSEREEYLAYVPTPYLSVQPVFYILKGKAKDISKYEDLYGKSIAFSISSAYFEPFNSDKKLNKVELSTEAQIVKMLALGRVDVAIGTDPNFAWDIAQLGYREAVERTSYLPPVRTDIYIAFARKSPAASLVPAVDKSIRRMIADGTIEAIAKKYR